MRKKKKFTREKGLEKHVLATRADYLMRSEPKIPNYGKLALRPGAEDYKDKPSVGTSNGVAERKESNKYSGERRLVGIGTMHKSNMIPIFSDEEAEDIAKMRRN